MSVQEYKLIFTGTMGAGKTTAITSISEIPPVSTDVQRSEAGDDAKLTTTAALDYGEVTLPRGDMLRLYGTPGQARFDFMWRILSEGALGVVVLVDNRRPDPPSCCCWTSCSSKSKRRKHVRARTHWQDANALPVRIDTVTVTPEGPRYAHLMPYPCVAEEGASNEDLLTFLRRELACVKGRLAAVHQELATVLAQRAQRFAGRTRKADPAASLINLLLRA
jgi:hypothetical protein